MRHWTFDTIISCYRELYCSTRTGFTDPHLRTSNRASSSPMTKRRKTGHRSFLVLDAGMMHDEHGYWVEDEDTEEQGFLSTETDHIWSYDENR